MSEIRLPRRIVEWETQGAIRKGRPKERWMDGLTPSMTRIGLAEEDTSDRDMCGNEFWVKENNCLVDSNWMNE
jgi:hypothetical protein